MEKIKTGGLRRHEIIYSLDTGRLMGDPFSFYQCIFDCSCHDHFAPLKIELHGQTAVPTSFRLQNFKQASSDG